MSIVSRPANDKYRTNYDLIFKDKTYWHGELDKKQGLKQKRKRKQSGG